MCLPVPPQRLQQQRRQLGRPLWELELSPPLSPAPHLPPAPPTVLSLTPSMAGALSVPRPWRHPLAERPLARPFLVGPPSPGLGLVGSLPWCGLCVVARLLSVATYGLYWGGHVLLSQIRLPVTGEEQCFCLVLRQSSRSPLPQGVGASRGVPRGNESGWSVRSRDLRSVPCPSSI